MAVGGMGDVLSGIIAALIAQGLHVLEAAQLGVWAHSFAADSLAKRQGEVGLRASDLIPEIRRVFNGIDV
jgi:NAD(P)H-hydrate epimerase